MFACASRKSFLLLVDPTSRFSIGIDAGASVALRFPEATSDGDWTFLLSEGGETSLSEL
jgi:hypothetical protein